MSTISRSRRKIEGRFRGVPGGFALVAVAIQMVSCGDSATSGQVERVTGAIVTPPPVDFQDATGRIRIRVKTCDATPINTTNCAYCPVDSGWGRVGGGARIYNQGSANAFLQASYPADVGFFTPNADGCTGPMGSPDPQGNWVTRTSGGAHQLQAYIVELQMLDANGVAFVPTLETTSNFADAVNPPDTFSASADMSAFGGAYLLIGGGAQIFIGNDEAEGIYTATDSYLVESRPGPMDGSPGRWQASARAQKAGVAEELKAYAIGIDPCPAQLGMCLSYPFRKETIAGANTGYSIATHAVPYPWVATCPGGYSVSGASGASYLASIVPVTGSSLTFWVGGKTFSSGSSTTSGYALEFGIEPNFNPGYFNTVVFIQGGSLYRPSGTNPFLQRTSNEVNTGPTHWSLEPLGGGTYRLRNGNPGAGGECAYRDGTTSNVRVTTCGATNNFKWKIVGTLGGVLELKNVSSGTCLDNNNVLSGGNSNLVLKACVAGGSASQQIFLDHWDWPVY